MNKKVTRYISLAFIILWMCLIFFFSHQPAESSDGTSGGLIEVIVSAVYPKFNFMDLADKNFIIELFSAPIRKAAHFAEFAVLGAAAFVYFMTFGFSRKKMYIISPLLLGIIYAVSDEIHQLFIVGRSCSAIDIFIDAAGVLFSILFFYLIFLRGDRFGWKKS